MSGRTKRHKSPRSAPTDAIARFKAEVDRVLGIDFVEWNQVDAYIARREGVLDDILALGAKAPSEALDAVLYFIEAIPSIFDSVHDETELAMFCEELCKAALSMRSKAGSPFARVATALLDAFRRDGHGRFEQIPEQLAANCTDGDRAWLRDEAARQGEGADQYQRSLLDVINGPAMGARKK